MRRLIASATLFVLLLPAVAFGAPPDRDPAGGPEYGEYVILLPGPFQEVELIEGEPAPRAEQAAPAESGGSQAAGSDDLAAR